MERSCRHLLRNGVLTAVLLAWIPSVSGQEFTYGAFPFGFKEAGLLLHIEAFILGFDVTTDGNGDDVVTKIPKKTDRSTSLPQPVNQVIPPNGNPSGSAAANIAAIDIAPSSTLFALTDSGSVLQLDTSPQAAQVQVREFATGQRVRAGVASPGNQFLYVASSGPQTSSSLAPSLRILDLTTFLETASLPLPSNVVPTAVALTPEGKYLYVAGFINVTSVQDPGGISCHVIDMSTRTLVTTLQFPGSFRPKTVMSPDGSRVYLTTGDGIGVIDVLTQTISHTIPIANFGDLKLAINPSGTALYVAPVFSSGSFGFAVYDTATSTNTINVPVTDLGTAMAMAVSGDGAYLVIEQIVPDASGRNDFPVTKWFSLPSGQLVTTNPWTGSRDTPITPHTLLPLALPPQ
jgi:hypothetical protein